MHSWRWFDQWISSSGRGVESYLFFYEIAGRSPGEPVGKIEDAPILNPRWEMQGPRCSRGSDGGSGVTGI